MFGFDRRLGTLLAHCDSLMFPSPSGSECEEFEETEETEETETEGRDDDKEIDNVVGYSSLQLENAYIYMLGCVCVSLSLMHDIGCWMNDSQGNTTNKMKEMDAILAFFPGPSSFIKLILTWIRLILSTIGKVGLNHMFSTTLAI
jgi:hypothetical protein